MFPQCFVSIIFRHGGTKLTDIEKFKLITELEKHPSIWKRGVYRKTDKQGALEEMSGLSKTG